MGLMMMTQCTSEQVAKPRPYQYPRIDYPSGETQVYTSDQCPFSIEIPSYAEIVYKSEEDKPEHPCWFDIKLAPFDAVVHCSYYPIVGQNTKAKLVEDAYKMVSKHNVKADFRDEFELSTKSSEGIIFKIDGPVATPYQFFITDDKDHFFRGSLYFDQKIEVDSMGPIVEYIENDVQKMLGSLVWK